MKATEGILSPTGQIHRSSEAKKPPGHRKGPLMSSISFPTTASNMPDRTQLDSAAKTTAVQSEQPTKTTATADTKDTVQISAAAQAKILHQAGQSVKSIASALGTDTKTVDDYLGIAASEALTAALKSAESATTAKA